MNMRKKFFFLFILLLGAFRHSHALTVYQFEYNQSIKGKTVPTSALFLQHDNGRGFLKTKYIDPLSGDKMLLDMELEEVYIQDGKGGIDTTKMYIKTRNVHTILGNVNAEKQTPVFLFSLNGKSGELEPTAIVTEQQSGNRVISDKANFKAVFITAKNLTGELLSGFFKKGDVFLAGFLKKAIDKITPDEMKTVIHLVVVADTLEEDIGQSCAFDVRRVMNTYTQIVNFMGARMKVRVVAGNNYSKRKVVSELKLLNPSKNDIVIFYYSGHGYRKPEDKRRFPYLDLRAKPEDDYLKETLNMEDIYKFIKAKGARMNVVLSDCCNSYVGATNSIASKPLKKKSIPLQLDSDHLRMLFLKGKISILATAADSTQRASSNNRFGGFFSYFFNTTLEASCSNSNIAYAKANSSPEWWNQVLADTRAQTEKKAQNTYCDKPYTKENICVQSPCFYIE